MPHDAKDFQKDSKCMLDSALQCCFSHRTINPFVPRIPQDQSSSRQSTSSWMQKLWKSLLVIFSIILQVFGIMWSAPVCLGYIFHYFSPTDLALGFFSHSKGLGAKWNVCLLGFFWANGCHLRNGSVETFVSHSLAALWGTWLLLQKRFFEGFPQLFSTFVSQAPTRLSVA